MVVIGVHSAKFTTEKDADNIRDAIVRYEIEHPVVVDSEHRIWNAYGARAWPTIRVIDPEGYIVAGHSGEFEFEMLDQFIRRYTPFYERRKSLDRSPIRFDLIARRLEPTPLRYPGKILADPEGKRLFISDSNHHRIVVCSFDGRLLDIIGSGRLGTRDGSFDEAEFHHPQGCALDGTTLYVADTDNHLLRKVDLAERTVTTIAGTGRQARVPWPGAENWRPGIRRRRWVGRPKTTALNSPWALWIAKPHLFIAMAGPHQIWRMRLDESEIEPYAGNSREDIVDGRLLPPEPYAVAAPGETPYSSFAQPSGLTSDGTWLFVADSEGSSIRAVPLDSKGLVRTVVGTAHLPHARLFTFGDQDGPAKQARLQHPLGVAWWKGKIYVADTYNNKIKVIDPETGTCKTLAGDGRPGKTDAPARFDEPAGLTAAAGRLFVADTNNHLVRIVDPESGRTETLTIQGLTPPKASETPSPPRWPDARRRTFDAGARRPVGDELKIHLQVALPPPWKINHQMPPVVWVEPKAEAGPVGQRRGRYVQARWNQKQWEFGLPVSGTGPDRLEIALEYPYCSEGAGVCRIGRIIWEVRLRVTADGAETPIVLQAVHEGP